RIGQDVVIQYVNADPDQPMITGRTYCGNQRPPYELPKHRTRMTIKSKTHKGQGFNELRFEDELGQEEVFIHAQRDQNNRVGNDETTCVGRNRIEQVGNDEQISVGNDLRQETGNDHTHAVGRDCHLKVGQDLSIQVSNDRSETIGVNQHTLVGGNSELRVDGHQRITVGQGLEQQTTVFRLTASERIELISPGASLVLDQQGLTLNGLTLNFHGPTQAGAEGAGNVTALELTANNGSACEEKGR
ncbi:type VI secretion system tip protein VgrG, partial [Pseudomonas sp. AA27]|uniref:bacteriophage T4 gp5 trimerisation domain-containing protein n=1 Tax=Pseudomonas sp. AA27 TaxID=2908652 RepID=UPI003FA3602A|nr:type VI secretion system tip protein VgrG [Pseudomonas sp. AA27]